MSFNLLIGKDLLHNLEPAIAQSHRCQVSNVKRSARHFSNPAAKAYFGNNAVYGPKLMEKNEAGRTLCSVFNQSRTIESLNKLRDEAQRRIIEQLPPTKSTRKRSRPDAIQAGTTQ